MRADELAAEGCEDVASLYELSAHELRSDFGVKRFHLKKIEAYKFSAKFREEGHGREPLPQLQPLLPTPQPQPEPELDPEPELEPELQAPEREPIGLHLEPEMVKQGTEQKMSQCRARWDMASQAVVAMVAHHESRLRLCQRPAAELDLRTSANLASDTRFDVIINSVSPEFQSTGNDSGLNFAVWQMLTGGEGALGTATELADTAGPVRYERECVAFRERNGGRWPTYGDVVWSEVPQPDTDTRSSVRPRFIVHALAPDRSACPTRLPTGITRETAYATLFAGFFRALWQVHLQALAYSRSQCLSGVGSLKACTKPGGRAAGGRGRGRGRGSGGGTAVALGWRSPRKCRLLAGNGSCWCALLHRRATTGCRGVGQPSGRCAHSVRSRAPCLHCKWW